MSEKMLITRFMLNKDGKVELYGRNHKYRDLLLFEPSDLADVDVDVSRLETGEEVPCRFWAVYEESEKLNQAGNPYRDVIALERIGAPATASSVDNSAIVEELRTIRRLLELVLFEGKASPRESVGASVSNGDQAAEPTGPVEPQATPSLLTRPESPTEPVGALNEDQARRQFGNLAGSAVRAKKIPAGMPRQLTAEVSAGAKSWRDALAELEREIAGGS
jgi:hypothetical protein